MLEDLWGFDPANPGEWRIGLWGSHFLRALRHEFREETGIAWKRGKRQVWRLAAEQHGFGVRPDPAPNDPPLMYPCERLAHNMLLHRVEGVLLGTDANGVAVTAAAYNPDAAPGDS